MTTPTPCRTSRPLIFGADPMTFKVCAFLVNVLSHMYDEWKNIKPFPPVPPKPFPWRPINACPITDKFNVANYYFGPLVWSSYKWLHEKETRTEPFACYVQSKVDGAQYVVIRGSKS